MLMVIPISASKRRKSPPSITGGDHR